ncbi:MAG TPA: hypothetical protein VFL82_00640 [Thermomicrobiales bacterium]|nr:hypothetical protein [Thermomicrobiales bacterium]
MANQQSSQSDSGSGSGNVQRPDFLDTLTSTQMTEFERNFDDHDRSAFDQWAKIYDLTPDQAQQMWDWFSTGPSAKKDRMHD